MSVSACALSFVEVQCFCVGLFGAIFSQYLQLTCGRRCVLRARQSGLPFHCCPFTVLHHCSNCIVGERQGFSVREDNKRSSLSRPLCSAPSLFLPLQSFSSHMAIPPHFSLTFVSFTVNPFLSSVLSLSIYNHLSSSASLALSFLSSFPPLCLLPSISQALPPPGLFNFSYS